FTMRWLREAVDRMVALAAEQRRPVPGLAPRIALRLTEAPIAGTGRLAGEGTIGQVLDDLTQLRLLGAGTVVLDPFGGDPAAAGRAGARARTSPTRPPRGGPMTTTITEADLPHLRRCVELAAEAVAAGDHPFGSVLVAADGTVLAEDRNREVTAGDATRHPEFALAQWAAANMTA